MKRIITFVAVIFVLALPTLLRAQSEVGTWKMNPGKSKFTGINAPKTLTAIVEAQEGGIRRHGQGIAADGTTIDYTYTAKYDGQDVPVDGSGAPGGADSVALKRIDDRTTEATWKKGGKVINTARYSLSKDGKVWTVSGKGTSPDGKPTTAHVVFEKQ